MPDNEGILIDILPCEIHSLLYRRYNADISRGRSVIKIRLKDAEFIVLTFLSSTAIKGLN
jgi:hypothetical protein